MTPGTAALATDMASMFALAAAGAAGNNKTDNSDSNNKTVASAAAAAAGNGTDVVTRLLSRKDPLSRPGLVPQLVATLSRGGSVPTEEEVMQTMERATEEARAGTTFR